MWESDAREKADSTDLDLAWMRVERRLPGMARKVAFRNAEKERGQYREREEGKID